MTCLVGPTPLRLHTLQDTPTRHLARHLAGDDRLRIATASLRIAPGHSRLQSSRLPDFQDHINHRRLLLGKINQMGTHLPTHHILPYIPFGNQPDCSSTWSFHCHSCTTQYFRWSESMRSHWQLNASIMEVFYFEFSFVFIVFAIYPKLLNLLLCCLVYSTGIYTHPFTFKPFHHGPYYDLVYHQDSFSESYRNDPSYRNERPYERRYDRPCPCSYYRTYDRR